jgi:hypothetical protein
MVCGCAVAALALSAARQPASRVQTPIFKVIAASGARFPTSPLLSKNGFEAGCPMLVLRPNP